jgi:hypothetical protein
VMSTSLKSVIVSILLKLVQMVRASVGGLMPLSTIFMLFHEFQFYEENECSETCLNRTFVGQTFVFLKKQNPL